MGITLSTTALAVASIGALVGASYAVSRASRARAVAVDVRVPATLRETGLYAGSSLDISPANRPFTPQYPLWSDGARKQRWIYLPPGTTIDGSQPDAWQFPVGTRLWKQFSFGRRTETRFMVRAADGWRYATYAWNDDESDAMLVSPRGAHTTVAIAAGSTHVLPGEGDCRACHANGPTPVLGFSALQLSPDRDPGALHAEAPASNVLDLTALLARGTVRDYPRELAAPRIAARTPVERSALGYLHGNCGGCHRAGSPLASLGMVLAYELASSEPPAAATTIGRPSQLTISGAPLRIAAGDPDHSVLLARVRSRAPATQMPPLGTQLVDDAAVHLLSSWITQLSITKEK